MNDKLINKLLQEQTTPEEEHLIAQLLRQQSQEHLDQWLVEDETEVYDRIVGRRQMRRRLLRGAVAAVVAIVGAAGSVVLWPHDEGDTGHVRAVAKEVAAVAVGDTLTASPAVPSPVVAQKVVSKPAKAKTVSKAADNADSLQIYIERLEQELAQVSDSSYTAKAEQIIRADARLQRLVRRIMMGEIGNSDLPMEAMIGNEKTEGQP